MTKKLAMILGLILGASALAGCVPLVIGAGAAIGADAIAEDRGNDLF